MRPNRKQHRPLAPSRGLVGVAVAAAALIMAGCASTDVERQLDATTRIASDSGATGARWLVNDSQRAAARAEVERLLAQPLDADGAVRVALAASPKVQAALSEHAARVASGGAMARLGNPTFALERLTQGDTRELTRVLSVGLADFITLPQRRARADTRAQSDAVRTAGEILSLATEARTAWIHAVAAAQAARYYADVRDAALAAAELARRMESVGNFNRLARAREQAFYADASTQLARAQHAAFATREKLVRTLGLDASQAARLTLPSRLPDLPASARDERGVATRAFDDRLDVRLARAELEAIARDNGVSNVSHWINGLHLAAIRKAETGEERWRGFELEFPLPIFDWGDARRAAARAAYMAQAQRTAQVAVDAQSHVAEAYHAYRTSYDIARHYRDEIVPLRQAIAEENLLRYNGMLIGVFELLADARAQVASVIAAVDAQRDFWLADAALTATLAGHAGATLSPRAPTVSAPAGDPAGH